MDSLFLLVFSLLLVNSCSCFSVNEGQRLPYMTSDIQQISRQSFDYIVVGGGASGCPLAVTLSERFSVLLIERGWSPYNNPLVLQSKKYGLPLIETDEFSSLAQSFVSEDGVANLRGRVLGGSTAINSGFYSRASEDFIERVGWDKKLVKEAYEWVESKIVFEQKELSEWQSVVKDGFVEGGGLPFNGYSLEHVAGTKVGGSIFDGSGRRHSAADLLAYGNLEKITLLLNATVESVIFDDIGNGTRPRAKGIRFINSDGDVDEIFEAYLNKQKDGRSLCGVILSAGALSSPQILMLSGIGPQEHLKTFGILPLVDAREVGRDIKDNPCFSLLLDYSPKVPIADIPQTVGITHDLQTILQSVIRYTTPNETRLRVGAKMVYPISKGKLELESRDPRKNPSVRFNYLVEERLGSLRQDG